MVIEVMTRLCDDAGERRRRRCRCAVADRVRLRAVVVVHDLPVAVGRQPFIERPYCIWESAVIVT